MPAIPVIAAVVTAGAAVYSASQSSKAVDQATQAQTQSNADALALQKSEFDTGQAETAPWRTVGAGALQMLARTEGIQLPADTFSYYHLPTANDGTSTASAGGGVSGQAGSPDWDAYLKANPDVMAWAQSGHGNPNTPIDQQTLEQRAAYHYYNTGQTEGRTLPTIQASATPAGGTATTPKPTNTGGQTLDPNGLPTSATSSRYGDFYASPDYQFRLNEGSRAITGNKAAAGLLDSGALGKGLINYGQQAASQEFGNWYNRIASLAGVGQTSASQSVSAGQANANAQTGIIQQQGQNLASSISTQGGINAGLINNLGNTASGLISNFGGGNSAMPVQSNNLGGLQLQSPPGSVSGLTSGVPSGMFGSPI